MLRLIQVAVVGASLAMSACADEGPSAAEQDRLDEAKIVAVKRAMILPPVPVTLQPITFDDMEEERVMGTNCSFSQTDFGDSIVALTLEDVAVIKIKDKMTRLVADKGAAEGPMGTHTHYDGKAHSLRITFAKPSAQTGVLEGLAYDAQLAVSNSRDQVVYEASGIAQCGS